MGLPFSEPPESVCILRLSSLGDVCNVLPVVRTLQRAWPETRFVWVIGAIEPLLSSIPVLRFVEYDKSRGVRALRDVARRLRGWRFDLLLHMQSSLRASSGRWSPLPMQLGSIQRRA
jgi:heptosyltransferase I